MSVVPPAVFLHGFLGAKDDWKMTAEALGKSVVKLGVDLPGHGDSKVGEDAFSFDGCSLLIADSVASMGVKHFSLVGYSMGGRIALFLALRYPQFMEKLVLISASPGLENDGEREARRRDDDDLARVLETTGLPAFLKSWYDQPLFASLKQHPELFEHTTQRRSRGNARSLARALRAFSVGYQPSLWSELPRLKMPALFIAGEMDKKFVDIARRMADLCPTGKACIIPAAGHAVHLEQPEALAEKLRTFLTEG